MLPSFPCRQPNHRDTAPLAATSPQPSRQATWALLLPVIFSLPEACSQPAKTAGATTTTKPKVAADTTGLTSLRTGVQVSSQPWQAVVMPIQ